MYRKTRKHEKPSLIYSGEVGIFINTIDDMQWLKDVHLLELSQEYKSAMVYGNEDCPFQIECYLSKDPTINDWPEVWILKEE